MSGGGEGETLEYTPTWVVAAVCTVIVAISLAAERLIHYIGVYLKNKKQKPLYEALQKVKEELMLLGFISLLLTVFQNVIAKMCVPADILDNMLPCKRKETAAEGQESHGTTTSHFQMFFSSSFSGTVRHLLAEGSASTEAGYCARKHKVPLLSTEALHHLHIFIFVLAIVHVTFCVLTIVFGGARIRQWKHWEDSIANQNYDPEQVLKKKVTHVHQHAFIQEHFLGIGKDSALLGWMQSFFKQFYASITKADYVTLRLGFIMTHCRGNPKFNFHKYMIRALEDDFKRVVGISWYLWIFVVIFLLLNINGWHTYFWIAFIPFIFYACEFVPHFFFSRRIELVLTAFCYICWLLECPETELLLAVGAKLEHVIAELAHEVAEKHIAIEGELVVKPSDEHFWFDRPHIVLFLIHFILFQNAFEIAFFFWIWVQYGFDSCIMGQFRYIVPRLVIGVFIQVLCSYSTLPLYAIVTQMGSSFKKAIFEEHVQVGLVGWREKAKRKKESTTQSSSHSGLHLGRIFRKASAPENVQPSSHGSDGSK